MTHIGSMRWLGIKRYLTLGLGLWLASGGMAVAQIAFRAAAKAGESSIVNTVAYRDTGASAACDGCSITPTLPPGTMTGDLLVLVLELAGTATTIATPSGWTSLQQGNNASAGNNTTAAVFYQLAPASPAAPTVTNPTVNRTLFGQIIGFRNVNQTTPIAGSSIQFTVGNPTNANSTTGGTVGTSMRVVTSHVDNDCSSAGTPSPGSWTQAFSSANTTGEDAHLAAHYSLQSSSGTQPAVTLTRSGCTADNSFGVQFVINAGSGGFIIPVPVGTTTGDFMLATVVNRPSGTTISTPTGWTLLSSNVQTNDITIRGQTYWRIATASEPASYSWTLGGTTTAGVAGGMLSFSGVDTSTPINVSAKAQTASGYTHIAPTVTTTLANTMLVTQHTLTSSPSNWTPPTGMTEAVDVSSEVTPSIFGISLEMNYQSIASTGATGTRSATALSAGIDVGYGVTDSIALRPLPAINHVEFVHNGAALTCTPKEVTVLGCTTAASCNGVAANQVATAFTITPSAIAPAQWCLDDVCASVVSGPISVTNNSKLYMRNPSATSIRLAGTAVASNTTVQCTKTNPTSPPEFNATTACDLSYSAAGLLLNAANHYSCAPQTITIQAVQSNATSTACIPAFANVTRDLTMYMSYLTPNTGTLAPSLSFTSGAGGGGSTSIAALSTSAGAPTTLSNLYWNASGTATITNFIYRDAGQIQLNPVVTGSGTTSGLTLNAISGNQPIVAPANFTITGLSSPLIAGSAFNATITAMNACPVPAATPNFTDTVTLTSSTPLPALGNATAISTTISGFSSGAKTTSLTWNEVGSVVLNATLANYLGASPALPVSGTTTATPFRPAYFDTIVTHGCSSSFTYGGVSGATALAGQPFKVEVKAKRFGGDSNDNTNTANYAGATWAKAVALSDAAAGTGTLSNGSFAATDFIAGKASRTDVSYAFANKLTAPYTLAIRAIDTNAVSSSGHTEGSTAMRSGRLRLSNIFGSEKSILKMPLQTQYWSSKSWVPNSEDSCSDDTLVAGNFYLSSALTTAGAITFSGGSGTLSLSAPAGGSTGSVDIAANLGSSGNDNACLSTHGGTAASLPWLRSLNGNCAATYNRDPSARATFGIYAPETRRTIHVREQF